MDKNGFQKYLRYERQYFQSLPRYYGWLNPALVPYRVCFQIVFLYDKNLPDFIVDYKPFSFLCSEMFFSSL